jgi:hypothetical protein
MLEELGKGLVPDWVAPPEGIQADPGEKTGNWEHESGGELDGGYNTRSKSRRSGAGLPIPGSAITKRDCTNFQPLSKFSSSTFRVSLHFPTTGPY